MSTYTDASLIVTPNAYKAGKLYSIKPTSGVGDLDVVRATSATRVNEQGLVEIPRTNLVLRSEEFENSYWSKLASSISVNATTSPNNDLTADKLVEDTSGSAHRFLSTAIATTNGVTYTCSIFLKSAGRNYAYVNLDNSGGTLVAGNIDLTNGTVTQTLAGSISVIPFTNGWYRVIFSGTSTSTSNGFFQIRTSNSPIYANYTGNGTSGIYIWGAQLEVGNVATEYIPTTSVIRTRFAGITQDGGSASNIPRLDYTNGSCPSILVEPQRTNLLLRSEEFDNATWTKTNSTITANATTSPSGTMTADKLVENNTNASHFVMQFAGPLVIGNTYFISIYLKASERNRGRLRVAGTSAIQIEFNLQNGTVSSVNVTSSFIQNVGNGWYRIGFSFIANDTTMSVIINPSNSTTGNSGFTYTYLGDNTSGLFLWGAQLEAGANATSYIPTVASTVTRNADVISKSGLSGITSITETFENGTTNVISGSPTSYTMSQGRIKHVIGI